MTSPGGRHRQALRSGDVVAYTLSYLLAVIAECSVFLGEPDAVAPNGAGRPDHPAKTT